MLTFLVKGPNIVLSFLKTLFESMDIFLAILVAAYASLTLWQYLGRHDAKVYLSALGHDGLTQRHVAEVIRICIVFKLLG